MGGEFMKEELPNPMVCGKVMTREDYTSMVVSSESSILIQAPYFN